MQRHNGQLSTSPPQHYASNVFEASASSTRTIQHAYTDLHPPSPFPPPRLHLSLSTTLSENVLSLHPIIIPSPRAVSTRQVRFACYPGIRMRTPSHQPHCPRLHARSIKAQARISHPTQPVSVAFPLRFIFASRPPSRRRSHMPKPIPYQILTSNNQTTQPVYQVHAQNTIPAHSATYQARLGFRACIKQKNAYPERDTHGPTRQSAIVVLQT